MSSKLWYTSPPTLLYIYFQIGAFQCFELIDLSLKINFHCKPCSKVFGFNLYISCFSSTASFIPLFLFLWRDSLSRSEASKCWHFIFFKLFVSILIHLRNHKQKCKNKVTVHIVFSKEIYSSKNSHSVTKEFTIRKLSRCRIIPVEIIFVQRCKCKSFSLFSLLCLPPLEALLSIAVHTKALTPPHDTEGMGKKGGERWKWFLLLGPHSSDIFHYWLQPKSSFLYKTFI